MMSAAVGLVSKASIAGTEAGGRDFFVRCPRPYPVATPFEGVSMQVDPEVEPEKIVSSEYRSREGSPTAVRERYVDFGTHEAAYRCEGSSSVAGLGWGAIGGGLASAPRLSGSSARLRNPLCSSRLAPFGASTLGLELGDLRSENTTRVIPRVVAEEGADRATLACGSLAPRAMCSQAQ